MQDKMKTIEELPYHEKLYNKITYNIVKLFSKIAHRMIYGREDHKYWSFPPEDGS